MNEQINQIQFLKRAFYRPDEVAAFLRLSRRTIYRMIRDGRLPGIKVGKTPWRISRQAFVNLMEKGEQ